MTIHVFSFKRNETKRSKFAILKHISWNKRLHLCCKSSKRFYFLRNSINFYVLFMQISVHSFMRNLYGFCWSISRFHLIAYADLSHSQMMHRFYCSELYKASVAQPIMPWLPILHNILIRMFWNIFFYNLNMHIFRNMHLIIWCFRQFCVFFDFNVNFFARILQYIPQILFAKISNVQFLKSVWKCSMPHQNI